LLHFAKSPWAETVFQLPTQMFARSDQRAVTLEKKTFLVVTALQTIESQVFTSQLDKSIGTRLSPNERAIRVINSLRHWNLFTVCVTV